MKIYPSDKIRNVAVVAHQGAGKTSLVEAMVYATGATSRLGKVDDGNTVSDYFPEEIKKKTYSEHFFGELRVERSTRSIC